MYGRPGLQQKRCPPNGAKEPKPPLTLKELGAGAAGFAPKPRAPKERQAPTGLGKISEVDEWADESSCAAQPPGSASGCVDEFEELWADVATSSSTSTAPAQPSGAPTSGDAGDIPRAAALLQRYGGAASMKPSSSTACAMRSGAAATGASFGSGAKSKEAPTLTKADVALTDDTGVAAAKDRSSDDKASSSDEITDDDSDGDADEPRTVATGGRTATTGVSAATSQTSASAGPRCALPAASGSISAVQPQSTGVTARASGERRRPRRERITSLPPVARASKYSKEPEIRKVFEEIDVDKRGTLSFEDLRSYLCDYLGFGQAEAESFFRLHGSNARISFASFQAGYHLLNPFTILKRHGETIIRKPGSLNGKDVSLEVEDCKVYICDTTAQVFADECRRSQILLGPCESSVFVRDCEDCTFWVAAQQLRTRDCRNCTFHLYSKTEPIIESSKSLSFSPWSAWYPKCASQFSQAGFDPARNLWNAVFDFTGKKDASNWRIMPLQDVQELRVHLDEPTAAACVPENPVPRVTHQMLCAEPLVSGESCGQGVTHIPQTRPPLPPTPGAGTNLQLVEVHDDAAAAERPPATSHHPTSTADAPAKATEAARCPSFPSSAAAVPPEKRPVEKPVETKVEKPASEKFSLSKVLCAGAGVAAPSSAIQKSAPAQQAAKAKAKTGSKTFARASLVKNAMNRFSDNSTVVPQSRSTGPVDKLDVPAVALGVGSLAGVRQKYGMQQPSSGHERNGRTLTPATSQEPKQDDCTEEVDDASLETEWDNVVAVTEEMRVQAAASKGKLSAQDDIRVKPISYNEVEKWMQQVAAIPHAHAKENIPIQGLDSRFGQETSLVFGLKSTDFDFNEVVHFRMLRTMYTKLTRNQTCPAVGGHWEVFGFQNTDPRMDLNRSGGVLNVVLLFYVFAKYPDVLKAAWVLSQDPVQNFPLACVGINIAKLVLDNFVAGNLSSLCKSSDSGVFDAFCDIYASAVHHFYSQWRSQKRTIEDSELTFREIRELLEKTPKRLIEEMANADFSRMESRKKPSSAVGMDFTDLSLQEDSSPMLAALGSLPSRMKKYQDGT